MAKGKELKRVIEGTWYDACGRRRQVYYIFDGIVWHYGANGKTRYTPADIFLTNHSMEAHYGNVLLRKARR